MSKPKIKKANCEMCNSAKKGEQLYSYDDRLLCVFCIAALMTETNVGVTNSGICVGDKIDS